VVLPAPGGATSTAALFARKTPVSSGNAASIGSGEKSIILGRHFERSEAIQTAVQFWIASSLRSSQ
jgi:hypothetical protein